MRFLSYILISLGFLLPEPYQSDADKLVRIYKQIVEIEKKLEEKKEVDFKLVDELNRLGYPIYVIYKKYEYYREKDERSLKLYAKAKKVYEEYMLIKRKLFPKFIKMDAKRNGIPLCDIELKGEEKRKLVIRIKHPDSDEEIRKLLNSTQLMYADRIGFDVIDFRPCKE
ncbi:hypothetical protein JCM9492_13790 [Aquifex pyrophilus]